MLFGWFFHAHFLEGDYILKIKKSHIKEEWIVYNPDNFALHTHCRSRRVALVIRNNVNNHRIPKTTDIRLLQSHIRVTKNKQYIQQLRERISEIEENKNTGKMRPQLENSGLNLCPKSECDNAEKL